MSEFAVQVDGLSKSFSRSSRALTGVDLAVEAGEMVALIGASGSGKSTLLRHLAGLVTGDRGTGGTVRIFGEVMQAHGQISPRARALRSGVGMIFQQFNLVPRLSVLTNVLTGTLGRVSTLRGTLGRFARADRLEAMRALGRVGIAAQALQRGATLSGGQQQRAAIARTLVQHARLIVADEPIASLDPSAARKVMEILAELNRADGITVVVSLHQVEYALRYCPRTVALRAGAVVYDGPSHALSPRFLTELYGAQSEDLLMPHLDHAGADPQPDPARAGRSRGNEAARKVRREQALVV